MFRWCYRNTLWVRCCNSLDCYSKPGAGRYCWLLTRVTPWKRWSWADSQTFSVKHCSSLFSCVKSGPGMKVSTKWEIWNGSGRQPVCALAFTSPKLVWFSFYRPFFKCLQYMQGICWNSYSSPASQPWCSNVNSVINPLTSAGGKDSCFQRCKKLTLGQWQRLNASCVPIEAWDILNLNSDNIYFMVYYEDEMEQV